MVLLAAELGAGAALLERLEPWEVLRRFLEAAVLAFLASVQAVRLQHSRLVGALAVSAVLLDLQVSCPA